MSFEEKELKAQDISLQEAGDTTLDLGQGKAKVEPQQRLYTTTEESHAETKIGSNIGNYRIIQYLGQGGMSVVYKGRHRFINRTVAIKLMKDSHSLDDQKLRRFHQEAISVGRIDHPGIVKVYEFDIPEDGLSEPFLVMDFVDGQTLSDIIRNEEKIEPAECQEMIAQCCDALQFAHNAGVVHRDIKPSNIMISRSDEHVTVKIVDFGIAKVYASDESLQTLTQTGEIFGSPLYMSPEQCLGTAIDHRSDIYSLGCVFYEALSGEPPFKGSSALQTMHMQLHESPDSIFKIRAELTAFPMLDAVFLKALAKDPAARYKTVTDFKDELLTALGSAQKGFIANAIADLKRFKRTGAAKGKVKFPYKVVSALVASGLLLGFVLSKVPLHADWESENSKGEQLFDNGDFSGAENAFVRALSAVSQEKQKYQHERSTLLNLQDLYWAKQNQASENNSSQKLTDAAKLEKLQTQEEQYKQKAASVATERTQQDASIPVTPPSSTNTDSIMLANNKAATLISEGEESQAIPILAKCLQQSKNMRTLGRVRSLQNMAVSKKSQGHIKEANTYAEQAYQLCRIEPSLKPEIGHALWIQAVVAFAGEDYQRSDKLLQESINNYRQNLGPVSDPEIAAQLLSGRAKVRMHDNLLRGQKDADRAQAKVLLDDALSQFESATDQLKDSNSPKAETEGAELQVFEAEALKSKLDYPSITKAQEILKKAIGTLEAIPIRSEEQDSVLGEALRTLSLLEPTEPSLARGAILRSLAIFKRLEASQTRNYILSLDAYSKMLITAHDPIDAEKCLNEAAAEASKLEGGQDGDLTVLIHAEQSHLKSHAGAQQAKVKD